MTRIVRPVFAARHPHRTILAAFACCVALLLAVAAGGVSPERFASALDRGHAFAASHPGVLDSRISVPPAGDSLSRMLLYAVLPSILGAWTALVVLTRSWSAGSLLLIPAMLGAIAVACGEVLICDRLSAISLALPGLLAVLRAPALVLQTRAFLAEDPAAVSTALAADRARRRFGTLNLWTGVLVAATLVVPFALRAGPLAGPEGPWAVESVWVPGILASGLFVAVVLESLLVPAFQGAGWIRRPARSGTRSLPRATEPASRREIALVILASLSAGALALAARWPRVADSGFTVQCLVPLPVALALRDGLVRLRAGAPPRRRLLAAFGGSAALPILLLALLAAGGLALFWRFRVPPREVIEIDLLAGVAAAAIASLVVLPLLLHFFAPRADQDSSLRVIGAGGLMDRLLGRRRGGRLLIDLGISACVRAERNAKDAPREAASLFREAIRHIEEFLSKGGEPPRSDEKRRQRYAGAIAVRARCQQGLDRLLRDDPACREWRRKVRSELGGFEDRFAGCPDAIVNALAVRMRAEMRDGDLEEARGTLGVMESLRPEDPLTVRGHLRLAQGGLESARASGDSPGLLRAALESYRTYVLRSRPARPEPWIRAGQAFESSGRLREAEEIYEKMLRWFSTRAPEGQVDLVYRVQRRLAHLYLARGDKKAARDVYFELVHDRTKANPYFRNAELVTRIETIERGGAVVADTEEMEIP